MLMKTKLGFLILLLFVSFLATHCYESRREDGDADDEARAKYEECQNLCDQFEGQRQEYTCRRRCKEQYVEYKKEIEKRSPHSGGERHGTKEWLGKCWKKCEERDEGIQTKFCKKRCETEYESKRGGRGKRDNV